jgi:hypothetical protein
LLDGHNRYAICQELGKPFSIIEMEFPDKDNAMLWILKNQLGRRNLNDTQFKLMVGKEYELEKKVSWGGDRKSKKVKKNQLRQSDGDDSQKETAERLAKEHKISPRTVERSSAFLKSLLSIRQVTPEVARKLETEEIKASEKDIRITGKALQLASAEQKKQIVFELGNDFKKATKTAKKIVEDLEPEKLSPEPEAAPGDHTRDFGKSCPDLDALFALADRVCCPHCGKNARQVLKWSCCGLRLDESANYSDGAKNKHTYLADSSDSHVKKLEIDNKEQAVPATPQCVQKEPNYSAMASWVPRDKSTTVSSLIHRA